MTKTFALFLDAYRELNAKRLFWFVLIISGFVVGAFGAVGLQNSAITLFGWETPMRVFYLSLISHETFYKLMFVNLGIKFWLSGLATILALASVAGIFPDFLAGGSIDVYLSKPIGRLRLFTVKYIGGLFFVTLQVTIFTVASYVVLGLRGGRWETGLFMAIPIVMLLFSYLYSICVLLGVLTRSTIASLLITLVIWAGIWCVHQSEVLLLRATVYDQRRSETIDKQIASAKIAVADPTSRPTTQKTSKPTGSWWTQWLISTPPQTRNQLESRLTELNEEKKSLDRFSVPHKIAFALVYPLPKTSETISLLERQLIDRAELPQVSEDDSPSSKQPSFRGRGHEDSVVATRVGSILRGRSYWWIIGTSLVFEAVMIFAAAFIFCRRDF